MDKLAGNKSIRILEAAQKGGYGVAGVCAAKYNLETILATIRAAERKRSPAQILLFPWSIHYAGSLLVNLAAEACRSASVPVSLHLDHAQDEAIIHRAAELPFDSIMVDMSHYELEENLQKTTELVRHCHERGIAVEAEPGRIEGGEDGVQDTALQGLQEMLTDDDQARRFMDTGIDFLAPAFGNVHGRYGGVENIKLDYERLHSLRKVSSGRALLVMHGTNEFTSEILKKVVQGGMTRLNVNDLVAWKYNDYMREARGKVPLTESIERGTDLIQQEVEWLMDAIGSSEKAA